jgi:hypothetical protein
MFRQPSMTVAPLSTLQGGGEALLVQVDAECGEQQQQQSQQEEQQKTT